MNILFLGYDGEQTTLIDFLESKDHTIVHMDDPIDENIISLFDYCISFGYRHIIKKPVIEAISNNIINLHISYLPYNRGSHPNFWSFYDNTPSGVTIHKLDEGLDTGDILVQKRLEFDIEKETFASTYEKLIVEIETLFKENCDDILNNIITPVPQTGESTYHRSSDLPNIESWNINIKEYLSMKKLTDLEIIDEIEKVRSKNNVNWMDILRLAFTHAPDEAREIVGRINKDDNKISELLSQLSSNE